MNFLERGLDIINEFKLNSDVPSRAFNLSKEVLKSTNYSLSSCTPTKNLESELGDEMFSLLVFASSLNLDLAVALEKSLRKMRARVEYGL